jgi:hypothetical protein
VPHTQEDAAFLPGDPSFTLVGPRAGDTRPAVISHHRKGAILVMTEILEVTALRPAPGLTPEDFVAANADINEYLKRQPGFQWRRIVLRGDGTILDIVSYDSIGNARSAAAGITGEMGDSPVHEAIDHSSVDWQFTTVLQHVE